MNRTARSWTRSGSFAPPTGAPLHTDTARIRVIEGGLADTTAERFPWAKPPVTRTYTTPRARLARRWAMVRHSPFAADLARARDAALTTAGAVGVIAFLAGFLLGTRVLGELLLVASQGGFQ
ncbi:hypothetical protein [Geodermatophilus chilensis]|uniref:hypothetical protein n=1 Tax=Geodermatophilus chilensis TaxID=2035835 RepID=UPI0012FFF689|nr:hypothetical protein [Geodermatophilus chilensis]